MYNELTNKLIKNGTLKKKTNNECCSIFFKIYIYVRMYQIETGKIKLYARNFFIVRHAVEKKLFAND